MVSDSDHSLNKKELEIARLRKDLELGEIYVKRGDLEEAIKFYDECLLTAEKLNDASSRFHILNSLGLIHFDRGEWDKALKYYSRSMKVAGKLGNVHGTAQTYNNMGIVYSNKGEWSKAQKYYTRSIEILEKTGDAHGVAQAYINIGSIYYKKGGWDTSIEFYEKSLEILESIGDIHGMAQTYNNLGSVFLARKKLDKSIEFYEKSLEILESIGDIHGMAQTYMNIGLLHAERRDFQKAGEYYNKSLIIKEEIGDKYGIAQTYRNMGALERDKGNHEEALKLLNKANTIFIELKSKNEIWNISKIKFECLYKTGKFELSIDGLSKMLKNSYRDDLVNETILFLRDFVVEMEKIPRWDIVSQIDRISSSIRDPQIRYFLKSISAYGERRLNKISHQEFLSVLSQIRNDDLSNMMSWIMSQDPSNFSRPKDRPQPMKSILMKAKQHIKKEKPFKIDIDTLGKVKIVVVGCGGAGNNTINRLAKIGGITGVETIAVNTDRQHLEATNADKRILIGRGVTKGLGASGDPVLGYQSAEEDREELKKMLKGANMVFVAAGMGGGTGTGSAPVIAEIASELDALVIGAVTLPFRMEGKHRLEKAQIGLKAIQRAADTVITLDNNKLMELCPNAPLDYAFSVFDEVLAEMVKGLSETILEPSLVNLDYVDVRAVMTDGGVATVGVGESNARNRAQEAVEEAIRNRLLEVDYTNAKGALVHVSGGPDMKLSEASAVGEYINRLIGDENSKIIWGACIDESLRDSMRVMLIVTGVTSPYISGKRPADGGAMSISEIFTPREGTEQGHRIYEYLGIDEVDYGR